jgi:hypothetical protein
LYSYSVSVATAIQKAIDKAHVTAVAVPSRNATDDKNLEVAVWYKTLHRKAIDALNIPDVITTQIKDNDWGAFGSITECTDSVTRSFTTREVDNIVAFSKRRQGTISISHVNTIIKLRDDMMKSFETSQTSSKLAASFSLDQIPDKTKVTDNKPALAFQLATKVVEQLRNARGEPLKDLLCGISTVMTEIANATRTGWATFLMLAKGMMTVGGLIKDAAAKVAAAIDVEAIDILSLFSGVVGITAIAVILAALIAILGRSHSRMS